MTKHPGFKAHHYRFVRNCRDAAYVDDRGNITISLADLTSFRDIVDLLIHEEQHVTLGRFGNFSEKQEHRMMVCMDTDFY